MKLTNVAVPTEVISHGSTVAEAFRECLRCNVQGIPFVDSDGCIVGQFSIRNTIKQYCISKSMIMDADLLGEDLGGLSLQDNDAAKLLSQPVDHFILSEVLTIHSASPCVKAISLMEKHDTTFLFVVDGETYKGIVNLQAIAKRMMQVGGF